MNDDASLSNTHVQMMGEIPGENHVMVDNGNVFNLPSTVNTSFHNFSNNLSSMKQTPQAMYT